MSVTEAQRLTLRTSLVAAIGEPATTVLMEAMPPIDYDNLATKADLNALRVDMDARFALVDARFVALTGELRGEMAEIRGEMTALGGSLRAEMAAQTRSLVATQIASMLGVVGLVLGFG